MKYELLSFRLQLLAVRIAGARLFDGPDAAVTAARMEPRRVMMYVTRAGEIRAVFLMVNQKKRSVCKLLPFIGGL